MSGNLRYWSFVGVLVAGVGVAVAVAGAQGSAPGDEAGRAAQTARREVMMLDGRGSPEEGHVLTLFD